MSQYSPMIDALIKKYSGFQIELFEKYKDYYFSIPFKEGIHRQFNDKWECFDDKYVREILDRGSEGTWYIKDSGIDGDFVLLISNKQLLVDLLPEIEKNWDNFIFNLEFFNLDNQLMYFYSGNPNYLYYNF